MIRSLAFVVYPVKDVDKATAFYRDLVGLKHSETLHEAWSEFDVGGAKERPARKREGVKGKR